MTTDVSPQQAEANRTITLTVYILHAASLFSGGITSLIAVILNYVKRDDVIGTIYESHFTWQIRTFWIGLLYIVIGTPLCMVLIGIPILIWWFAWSAVRIVRGGLLILENKPIANPKSWPFG